MMGFQPLDDMIYLSLLTAALIITEPSLTALNLSSNNRINGADAYRVVSTWRKLQPPIIG